MKVNESVVKALYGAAGVYDRKLSEMMLAVYCEALGAYPPDDVVQAIQRHLVDPDAGQFWPKPADIVRQMEGDTRGQAKMAWSRVIDAASRVGTYESVVFDDPLIHVVVAAMGGWMVIGHIDEDSLPFREQDFVTLYQTHRKRRTVPRYPKMLTGRIKMENSANGFDQEIPPPVLIGDQRKALAVLEGGSDKPALTTVRLNELPVGEALARLQHQAAPKQEGTK